MTSPADQDTPYEHVWRLVKDIRFGMLTTKDSDGSLSARPMTTVQKAFDGTLWFFTSRSSPPAFAIAAQPEVGLQYVDTHRDVYVSLSGEATIEHDRVRMEGLWSPPIQAWFPKGVDDPDLVMLRVDVYRAEYWDVKESKPVQLFKMAKAVMKGERVKNLGEHHSVTM
jgi:general stress protein 26